MSTLDAWQGALAAEHQAVFGYGLLGPQLPAAEQPAARNDEAAHIALRNAAVAGLTAAGKTPVAPLADYPALYPVASAQAARKLAIALETTAAAAWRYFYAVLAADPTASGPLRADAQAALTASAVRGTQWRLRAGVKTTTVAFPGI